MVAVLRNTVFAPNHVITLTYTDSDGSSNQKYTLCKKFQRSGENNSHVRNLNFADKIWPDRFRRSILCEIYTTSTTVGSLSRE